MVLFCPIWTCPFIIHFISASHRKTTSEHQNSQGFTNIHAHMPSRLNKSGSLSADWPAFKKKKNPLWFLWAPYLEWTTALYDVHWRHRYDYFALTLFIWVDVPVGYWCPDKAISLPPYLCQWLYLKAVVQIERLGWHLAHEKLPINTHSYSPTLSDHREFSLKRERV